MKVKGQLSILHIHALMVLTTILVSTSFIVMARIAGEMDSLVLTLLRFALAALFFLPIIKYQRLSIPTFREMRRYSVLGLCQAVFFVTMFEALRYTSSINTATLFTLVPIVSGVFAYYLLKERLGAQRLVALFCAAVGALWVIMDGKIDNLLAMHFNKGDLLFLVSVFAFGVYGPLINFLHRGEPMLKMTFGTVASALLWLAFFVSVRGARVGWHEVPSFVYIALIYLAIFTTIVTFLITQTCAVRIGPTRMMAYMYMTPSFVLLISWIGGKQHIGEQVASGVVLTLAGSLILHWKRTANTIIDDNSAGTG